MTNSWANCGCFPLQAVMVVSNYQPFSHDNMSALLPSFKDGIPTTPANTGIIEPDCDRSQEPLELSLKLWKRRRCQHKGLRTRKPSQSPLSSAITAYPCEKASGIDDGMLVPRRVSVPSTASTIVVS